MNRAPLHVSTNLAGLSRDEQAAILLGLAAHVGLDLVALAKARQTGNEPPDPRYPELISLVRAARRDWDTWGQRLVDEVGKLLQEGKLLPMTATNEALLTELFRDHEVAFLARFAGHVYLPRFEALVRRGLVAPDVKEPSYIETAYRLGRGLEMLEVHRVKGTGAPPLASIVRDAVKIPLTAQDKQAMGYAQRRAAIYMRRPVDLATDEVARVLNDREAAIVRGAVARGVAGRLDHRALARDLHDSLQGHPTLINDMERVARTELAFAHSWGAYVALKKQAADAGHADPEVYKFVAPGACDDCKRIWGPPQNPNRYRLSYIEGRESDGGNFRKPRKEWGPVIGPVHPRCTEGPLQFYHPRLVSSINEAAEEILQTYRR